MWLPPMCRQNASLCFLHVTPGLGYELEHFMQRATSFFIPMGIAVAKDWAAYTIIPDQTTGSFFWWTPDPTFLHFTSRQVIYPLLDTRAYARGDFRTGGEAKQIEKYVSQNLKKLSENIWSLIRSFSMDSNALEELMLDEKQTSDTPRDVACRWLQNHDEWHDWLPGPAQCTNQFGLYNAETSEYVLSRTTNEALTCRACLSGHKSTQLIDTLGTTRVCEPCSSGTAQANGAAEECIPCPPGEYQNDTGKSACKRCDVSTYQNLTGQDACLACPNDRTTQRDGSDKSEDCVCKSGMIEDSNGTCLPCEKELEGLVCPKGSTVVKLVTGVEDGEDGPVLKEGYSSTPSDPLVIYKCSKDVCKGGKPGQCEDHRVGPTCGHCPSGTYLSYFGMCTKCGAENAGLWFGLAVLAMGAFAYAFYYALTRGYKARGDAAVVTSCGVGMALNLIQNVMVVSAAPTVWPTMMIYMVDRFHVLTLNLEALGLSCPFWLTLDGPMPYIVHVSAFPIVICILLLTSAATRCFPWNKLRLPNLAWSWHGTASVVGKFYQVTFPTMTHIAFTPLMCYSHPMGAQSLLKHTGILCWTESHYAMLVAGILMLISCTGFLAFCFFAAWRAPQWSLESQAAVSFLVDDFRPDLPWFGLVALSRGLLLSFPSVLAANSPELQLLMLHSLMLTSLFIQGYFKPWKAPALNLIDSCSQFLFVSLLSIGLGGVERTNTAESESVLLLVGSVVCTLLTLIFVLAGSIFLVALLLDKVFHDPRLGSRCASLGILPEGRDLFHLLRNLGSSMKDLRMHKAFIIDAMGSLGAHDANMLLMSLLILQSEVGLNVTSRNAFRAESGDSLGTKSDSLGAHWQATTPKQRLTNSTPLSKRKHSARKAFQIRKHVINIESEPSDNEGVVGQDQATPVEDSESGSILPLDSKLSGQEVKIVSASCDGEPENGDHGRIDWSKVGETDELADPKRLVETYC
eukprot:symbB.v1.2.023756.t1/scaffold2149.1/size87894/1